MILVTCYKKDCPTPHFIVNPKGGRIKLVAGADSPDVAIDLSTIKQLQTAVQDFRNEETEISKEKLNDLTDKLNLEIKPHLPTDNRLTLTQSVDNAKDYIVMQCESNHKNYIIIEEFPEK